MWKLLISGHSFSCHCSFLVLVLFLVSRTQRAEEKKRVRRVMLTPHPSSLNKAQRTVRKLVLSNINFSLSASSLLTEFPLSAAKTRMQNFHISSLYLYCTFIALAERNEGKNNMGHKIHFHSIQSLNLSFHTHTQKKKERKTIK